MSETNAASGAGQRGKADHSVRDQIISAANEHFSHYGYGKTTVSDLAKAIGFSKAYIYKFFDSKQAIGEAICSTCLGSIVEAITVEIASSVSATDKFRKLFKTMVIQSVELFFTDRKLYDIAAYSMAEKWESSSKYVVTIGELLQEIIIEGRESGEFERKTPLDETVRAILLVMEPCTNPLMLQYNLDHALEASAEVASLVLRSLVP